jgi:precorrin-6A synthase
MDEFDVLFVVTKTKVDLTAPRRALVERHRTRPHREVELPDPPRPWRDAPDYKQAVARWREQRAELWEPAIAKDLGDDETGAFLVWGDPSLYESTLSVAHEVRDRGALDFELEVIPGVSSLHALTARHQIPLNRVGRAVTITPARLLKDGMPGDDVVVMLDADTAFTALDPDGIDIYWGAYLGTGDEILISGALAEVSDEIVAARERAREEHGWIFDIYLLRRRL